MSHIRSLLTNDHRHCDDLFAGVEAAVGRGDLDSAVGLYTAFARALEDHFRCEEQELFPAFEERTGMRGCGPTEVMRQEHAQLRECLAEAGNILARGDFDAYLGEADTLLLLMQQHNMKEENALYPMCDQHLGADAHDVAQRLESCLHGVGAES